MHQSPGLLKCSLPTAAAAAARILMCFALQLRSEAASVARDLAFTNAQVESEWQRWHASRVEETGKSLLALTGAYLAYWSAVAEAWRETAERLKASPLSTTSPPEGSPCALSQSEDGENSHADLSEVPLKADATFVEEAEVP